MGFSCFRPINNPANGDHKMILPYHLGLDHEVGIDFLSMTGLVRKVNSRNLHCTVVVQAEWANFVVEQHLSEMLDTVNKPVVSQSRKNLNH